jgi:PPOX class probable F420-dependent enzyme
LTILDPLFSILDFCMRISPSALRFVRAARVAHLATADASGQPLVIPICFAFDGKEFFSPIDEKPKRTSPRKLKRLRNIAANPNVSLIIDRYDENWQRLAYVLIRGSAKILLRGARHRRGVYLLRRKYPQYRSMAINDRPMIVIIPKQLTSWGDL